MNRHSVVKFWTPEIVWCSFYQFIQSRKYEKKFSAIMDELFCFEQNLVPERVFFEFHHKFDRMNRLDEYEAILGVLSH